MRELSLHILDVAQNSLSAGAALVDISVLQDTEKDVLTIHVLDNGRGMSRQQAMQAADPFYTTRTTRSVGMGLPLFRMAARQTGGDLHIQSCLGKGTTVTAWFTLSHVDRAPLGDLTATMMALIQGNPEQDFVCRCAADGREFMADTREMRRILQEIPLSAPEVAEWVDGYIREGTKAVFDGLGNGTPGHFKEI